MLNTAENLDCNVNEFEKCRPILVSILPQISFRGTKVFCNGEMADLARRPLCLRLFRAFAASANRTLSKRQLIDFIYEELAPFEKSRRYLESVNQNLTKLISRSRVIAEKKFFNNECTNWIEWFVYDPDIQRWHFYMLKNSYLKKKEQQIQEEITNGNR
jgi:hypothetical protein